jgi:hypothetical protein
VNAAKWDIQTFKDAFISTLVTTNTAFHLQLWGKLASKVLDILNLLRAFQMNPAILVYKDLHGLYDWD